MADGGRPTGEQERGDGQPAVAESAAARGATPEDALARAQRELAAEREARAALEHELATARRTAHLLEGVIDASPTVIHVVDTAGAYIHVNRTFEQLFKLTRQQVQGQTLFDVWPPAVAAELWRHDEEVIAARAPREFENVIPHADGPHVYLTVKAPLLDGEGTVRAVAGISTDITARKAVEEALRHSEERFAKVFAASPVSISITRLADGTFVDVNEACEQLTGYPRAELLGRTGLELGLWPASELRDAAVGLLRERQSVRALPTKLRRRSGELRDVLMSLEIILLGGQPCILALSLDVTEHARLEEQLRQSLKMEAIGRLAGGVAHDFNNILTTIGGHADMLALAVEPDARLQRSVASIRRATSRAASLTRQLLVFGRRRTLEPVVLDLNQTILSITGMLRPMLGEDIELVTELAADLGAIRADAALLEQVIVNLAANARDAMPAGGRLALHTENRADAGATPVVRLEVSDTGVGMSADTRARIFEPFFTTKETGKGTGLGLSSVYSIVQQSGGSIGVESVPGAGTTFYLDFPRVAAAAAPAPLASRAEPLRGQGTVLLVEDEVDVRCFAREVLERGGYTVLEAAAGGEALRLAEEQAGAIAAVVSDVVMPGMSGFELVVRLRSRWPGIAALLISGYPGDRTARPPDVPFLDKPFTAEDLLAALGTQLPPEDPGPGRPG